MQGRVAGSLRQSAISGGVMPHRERRGAKRIPVEIWVEESSERELYFQRGANLSTGGIFLQRAIPQLPGTLINLQFTLPGDVATIHVRGEVVNVGDEAADLGMGVKFVDLAPADRCRIEAFVTKAEPQPH